MPHSSPTRTRSRLAPDERIARIMRVTRQMLSEIGYEKIVTVDIAQRCNISEATIYKYFSSKRDLLIKVAEQWFEEILNRDRRAAASLSIHGRLRHLIEESLSVVRTEPSLTRFILMDLRPDPAYRTMHIYTLNRRFTGNINALLSEAIASGEFRNDVPIVFLRDMIFGAIEHQTWAYLRGEGDFSVNETADSITDVIYRGMVAAPDQS